MAAAWLVSGRRDEACFPPRIISRSRVETGEDFYVGTRRGVLHPFDGDRKIARRRMLLDQAVLTAKNLCIFL